MLTAVSGILLMTHCSSGVDRSADFAMIHNGNPYRVRLAPPIARVVESDAGYTGTPRFYVMFPVRANNPVKARGFQLYIDPEQVVPGKRLSDSLLAENSRFRIEYYPVWGHKIDEGILLAYTTGIDGGSFTVRFDIFEPRPGGRVTGEIQEAVLLGYYEKQDDPEIIPLEEPRKLEIYHFKFDTTFQIHPY